MRDMVNTNGYYQKALGATSDATANFKQRTKELNAVLDSSPQKFKQVMTIMQNVLADSIQPLLPSLVAIAQSVANLFRGFENLEPSVKKLIVVTLLLTAAVGPILRYLGSLATLFGFVGTAALKTVTGVSTVLGWLWKMAKAPFKWIFDGLGMVITGFKALPGAILRGLTSMAAMPGFIGSLGTGLTVAAHMLTNFWKNLPAIMGRAFLNGMAAMKGPITAGITWLAGTIATLASNFLVPSFVGSLRLIQATVVGKLTTIFTTMSASSGTFFARMGAMWTVGWMRISGGVTRVMGIMSLGLDRVLAGMYLRSVAFFGGFSTFLSTAYLKLGVMMTRITTAMASVGTLITGIWPAIVGARTTFLGRLTLL